MTGTARVLTHTLAAAALALLAAAVVPSQARAGCGDYVMIGGKHAPMAQHDSTQPDHAPAAPAPCHGPGCRQAPAAPPLVPPAPPPSVNPAEWACLFAHVDESPSAGRAALALPDAGRPVHRSDPIFHPPRA